MQFEPEDTTPYSCNPPYISTSQKDSTFSLRSRSMVSVFSPSPSGLLTPLSKSLTSFAPFSRGVKPHSCGSCCATYLVHRDESQAGKEEVGWKKRKQEKVTQMNQAVSIARKAAPSLQIRPTPGTIRASFEGPRVKFIQCEEFSHLGG